MKGVLRFLAILGACLMLSIVSISVAQVAYTPVVHASPFCIPSKQKAQPAITKQGVIYIKHNSSRGNRSAGPRVVDGVQWLTYLYAQTNACGQVTGIFGSCVMRTPDPVDTGNLRCILQKNYTTQYDSGFEYFNDTGNYPIFTPGYYIGSSGTSWRIGIVGYIDWGDGNAVVTPSYPEVAPGYWEYYKVP